jgi:hypothetical protein
MRQSKITNLVRTCEENSECHYAITGFGVCFVSYCGKVRAAIVADGSIATPNHVKFLTSALENEILALQDELRERDDFV